MPSGVSLTIVTPDIEKLRVSLGNVFGRTPAGKQALAFTLKDALEKAVRPALAKLKQVTPRGPTENLFRAAESKVKPYPREGNAVAIIGYRRAGSGKSQSAAGGKVRVGPDRAFHQWWVENGTNDRTVGKFSNTPYQRTSPTKPFTRTRMGVQYTVQGKGVVHNVSGQNAYIASSFAKLGPFKFVKDAQGVKTDPAYPKAFFKKSSTPIILPGVPIGGVSGRPPVATAWSESQSEVTSVLRTELAAALERAIARAVGATTGTETGSF
jgi:hypothetical protein